MKRTLAFIALLLLPLTSYATCGFTLSSKDVEGSEWSKASNWTDSAWECEHMMAVIATCKSTGFLIRHSVKINHDNGKEELFLCSDVLNKSH